MFDHWFTRVVISGFSAGQEAPVVPGCRTVERRLFASVNLFMLGMSGNFLRLEEKRSVFLAANQWHTAYLYFVNPFHARHVREWNYYELYTNLILEHVALVFPDMPCMKWVYKDKKASFHQSEARNQKNASRASDKPRIHRRSTSDSVRPSVFKSLPCLLFWNNVKTTCPRCLGGNSGLLFPGRITFLPDPSRPLSRELRTDPTVAGFWIQPVRHR